VVAQPLGVPEALEGERVVLDAGQVEEPGIEPTASTSWS